MIHYKFDTIPVNNGKMTNYGNLGTNYDANIHLTSSGIEQKTNSDGTYYYYWKSNAVSNNFLSIPNDVIKLMGANGHSIAFWSQDNKVDDNDFTVMCGPNGAGFIKIHTPWADGKVYYILGDLTNSAVSESAASLTNSDKTHWVFSRTNVANGKMILSIFKNGVQLVSGPEKTALSVTGATNYPVYIGYNIDGTVQFKDKTIEDFRIYDKPITAAEITALYQRLSVQVNMCFQSASNGTNCPALCHAPVGFQTTSSGANLEPCPVNTFNNGSRLACTTSNHH